jgi:hypothetical protein
MAASAPQTRGKVIPAPCIPLSLTAPSLQGSKLSPGNCAATASVLQWVESRFEPPCPEWIERYGTRTAEFFAG